MLRVGFGEPRGAGVKSPAQGPADWVGPRPALDGQLTLAELRQWGPTAPSPHDEQSIVCPS